MLYFQNFSPELLTAAIIPGVEIFTENSACVVFLNMQNSNFRAAPEFESNGFALMNASMEQLQRSGSLTLYSSFGSKIQIH